MSTPPSPPGIPPPYRLDYGDSEAHRLALAQAVEGSRVALDALWLRAFSLGARAGPADLAAYLEGLMPLGAIERDVFAHAMNELLDEQSGPPPVPYSRTLQPPPLPSGALAAFTSLLDGARYCPPERLASLADRAARTLGVAAAVIHLVDYEQRRLTALLDHAGPSPEPLSVEGSMAGRAFRSGRTVAALNDPPPRYWISILDSDERLGVLEVVLSSPDQVDDPHLRRQCEWMASLLGHLVAGLASHGDFVDAPRRASPRTPGAELIWQLLPPLTGGVDDFVVSGLLAPANDLGGDIFDYALTERSVSLAVFDAMGHGIGAGLIAAAAVSTYRAARRAGEDLRGQAAAVDGVLASLFPEAFATGVLVELDLSSGRLTYLNAGHPQPLLLRSNSVIAGLAGGNCLPLGLNATSRPGVATVPGEATLQPGDWLALFTDGVTEARAADGSFYGDDRLIDSLERAAAAGQPPPETVRRLLSAVLDHQHGVLQDDATLLLAQWWRRSPPDAAS